MGFIKLLYIRNWWFFYVRKLRNLLIKKEFKGLQDIIIFDQYGDVIRKFNTFKVVNGKFEIIEWKKKQL